MNNKESDYLSLSASASKLLAFLVQSFKHQHLCKLDGSKFHTPNSTDQKKYFCLEFKHFEDIRRKFLGKNSLNNKH